MPCYLPIEVAENIIDYHKFDPPTLLVCALVCRKWAPRSRYHLQQKSTLTIRSAAELKLIGQLLTFRRSRGLFAKVRLLRIVDDPSGTFVHRLSTCLPGQFLPEVATVILEGVDGATFRPHGDFFIWLSQLSFVTALCLHRCILRPVAHALRIARNLPRLRRLLGKHRNLDAVGESVVPLDNVLVGTESDPKLHEEAHQDMHHSSLETGNG
ncbi:hypothetical protein EVJ58_g7912 [Rhodofomes roseus]|uniref:F-box domain-containing protein n=1 Tax=Rhodofomes roseus TaxID=34475 RepID=A0A4Y9Y0W0_9APHY|nr:hypothetical protein EVJ58_g7912 [Rhodofomes roseus]